MQNFTPAIRKIIVATTYYQPIALHLIILTLKLSECPTWLLLRVHWYWLLALHAYEMHAHEVHAHELYAPETHAYEVHAHEMHTHKVYACETHAHERHAHKMHAHETHPRDMRPMR